MNEKKKKRIVNQSEFVIRFKYSIFGITASNQETLYITKFLYRLGRPVCDLDIGYGAGV